MIKNTEKWEEYKIKSRNDYNKVLISLNAEQ